MAKEKPCVIWDDPRPIRAIWFEQGGGHVIGTDGVTAIVVYKEYGIGDFTPFLAVYQGEHIYVRVAAFKVSIHYENLAITDERPF